MLHHLTLCQQVWQSLLYRAADREIGIRHNLQARQRLLAQCLLATDYHPPQFGARQRQYFRQTAQRKVQARTLLGKRNAARPIQRVIVKHLVADDSYIALAGQCLDSLTLGGTDIGPSGIVGIDQNDGARARVDCSSQAIQIYRPAPVAIAQRIRADIDAFQTGQVLKERITRTRHQYPFARIAEQLKKQRIGFARATRKTHARAVYRNSACAIIGAHRIACSTYPTCIRRVYPVLGRSQNAPYFLWIIDSGTRRIRQRQVHDISPCITAQLYSARQRIGLPLPI